MNKYTVTMRCFSLLAFASEPYRRKIKMPPDFVRKAFVRGMRFELTRLAALPPQSSASTNFATHASTFF